MINAIDAAIQLKNKYNIRVINLSLGRPVFESYTARSALPGRGDGPGKPASWWWSRPETRAATRSTRTAMPRLRRPANDPLVITVGAMKTMRPRPLADDLIASYSSKGPTLVGPRREARPGRAGQPDHFAAGLEEPDRVSSRSTNKILYSYYQNTPVRAIRRTTTG